MKTKRTITNQDLKVLTEMNTEDANPRFKRLKKKLLTCAFIDSIPSIMEEIKTENKEKYVFLSTQFIAIIDKHDTAMEKLRLEKQKIEQNERRLQLDELRAKKLLEGKGDDGENITTYENAVVRITTLDK